MDKISQLIAEPPNSVRIAAKIIASEFYGADLANAITEAIMAERERCAALAESADLPYTMAVRYIAAEQNYKIAQAIRGQR